MSVAVLVASGCEPLAGRSRREDRSARYQELKGASIRSCSTG